MTKIGGGGVSLLLLTSAVHALLPVNARSGVGAPLIIKGDVAAEGEFPHIVQLHLLTDGNPYICGGSIIGRSLILTAAHCLEDFVAGSWTSTPGFSIKVIAGALDWYAYGLDEHSQKRRVVQFVRHEDFSMNTIENDVAVLVLSHPLNYTRFVQAIRLPKHGNVFEGLADICGWGHRQNSELHYKPQQLRRAKVHLHNDTFCEEKGVTWTYGYDRKTMVCAGGLEADTCQGDSGGPLTCDSDSSTKKGKVLCGITSWGVDCGESDVPGMFTRVSTYTPWIQKQMAQLGRPCRPGEFYCAASPRLCIPLSRVCDGQPDCMNGVDEADCSAVETCPSDSLQCGSGECMPADWACDYEKDCVDGSDEDEARCRLATSVPEPEISCDLPYELPCEDGICFPAFGLCDSIRDCPDGSDEKESWCGGNGSVSESPTLHPPPPREGDDPAFKLCGPNVMEEDRDTFRCKNGQCVSRRFRCDGAKDCQDSSDELDCANHTCMATEFQCAVGHCIPLAQKCDNELDCTDQSDELNSTCWGSICGPSHHKCDAGQCLDSLLFCDGHPNCADGSDEALAFCKDYLPQVPEARSHAAWLVLHTKAQLTCLITATNISWLRPELEWLLDGNVITDDSRLLWLRDLSGMTKNLTLLFPNVTLADMGDYACRVGSAGHEFAVRVTVSEYTHAQEDEPSTTDVVDEQPRTNEGIEPQSEAEHALDPTSVGRRRAFWTQTFILLEAALGLVLVLVLAAFAWKRWTRCRSQRRGFEGLVNEAADVDEEVAGADKTTLQMHQL